MPLERLGEQINIHHLLINPDQYQPLEADNTIYTKKSSPSSGSFPLSQEHERQLRAFLSHSSHDKKSVRELYHRLRAKGIDPWLDEESLLPGQDWDREISVSIKSSDVVLLCLSKESISNRGYFQKELRYALDVANEIPDGTIFIIPLKLEECEVPYPLRRWYWVEMFKEEGFDRLMQSLKTCASQLGINRSC